ncbi:YhfC family intramembrane metalloprotease [Burkholderia aenigmatica]|uniref:Membrane protein n=1 Tax=Burkholderia aenigmatica TaxID=2015348 RepID=A0A6J5J146_9BURK|nr:MULTISPECIES: YhfC family glutamic-type intramembrane protease [Burkholderia]MCA8294481.1 YhfC family intramembrane metalloprotease [Burkholderia sp. AU30198]UKD10023.1 YhfC family intramembrane metalloprotease [Burkholderia aenigmatica]CAB3965332.1 membrane protein [Burkholderia aenigmatica]
MTVAPVTLAVLIAATLIIALLPLVLYRLLRKPLALNRRDTIVGVAVFTLFAMILERAFHGLVLSQTPPDGWLTQPLAFVAYSALATAVFEEVGRYLGMRFLSRRNGPSAGDGRGIGYGIGHGGAEAWFVGVLVWGQWSYLAWLASRGQLETQLADLPGDTVVRLHVMLATLSAQSILLLLLERCAAFVLQLALSVLVWRGVRAGRAGVLPLAIVLHALAAAPALLYQVRVLPAGWVEAAYFVLAAILVVVLVKACRPSRSAA